MQKLITWAFGSSSNKNSLGNQFRQKRMVFFKAQLSKLPRPIKILDVGGTEDFWINAGLDKDSNIQITILNLKVSESQLPNFDYEQGDATDLSKYTENSFDIAFSNSVIEHLFNKSKQQKMAKEMMRVGKYFYVQTPNKYFIVEPHYLLPYFQFFPKKFGFFILTRTRLSRLQKWNDKEAKQYLDEIVLLSKKDMQSLFPEGNILEEKFLGMTKSFVMHNFE